jgi:hypothetical protein
VPERAVVIVDGSTGFAADTVPSECATPATAETDAQPR